MAEEFVVKEYLTPEMIHSGAELTRRLDEVKFPVLASFWLFLPEKNLWRLILASPVVAREGLREAYGRIRDTLRSMDTKAMAMEDVAAVASDDALIKLLASRVTTGWEISDIRLSREYIEGRYVGDAYIYRVIPESAAA